MSYPSLLNGLACRLLSIFARRRAADRRALVETLEPRVVLSAGTLDPSFGDNGELAIAFPSGESITVVRDSLVQPDGKIVVAGEAPDQAGGNGSDFAIARLNPDGSPDLSFNGTGIFVFPAPGNVDEASGVALQSDGKIVVSATFGETNSDNPTYGLFAVGRFNTDGTVDETFGDEGALVLNFTLPGFEGQFADAADVLVGPDDKITIIGYAAPDPSAGVTGIALARLNADGTADASFGFNGQVLTSVTGGIELGLSGAFDAAGNIIVTGTVAVPGGTGAQFLTTRFRPDGSVDATFGNGGAAITDFSDPFDASSLGAADAVAVQPDGRIVVAGLSGHVDANDEVVSLNVALARYGPDGSVDRTFGNGGQTESDLGQFTSINKLLIDSSGRIIASGLSARTTDELANSIFNPFVAQYTPAGQLDPTFGNGGAVIIDTGGLAPASARSAGDVDAPKAGQAALALGAAALTASGGLSAEMLPPAAIMADDPQAGLAVLRRQSAIVVAIGNSLLVVSTSNDQLTAARLIGNGADLSAGPVGGITTSSVLGGAKGKIALPITNVGNESLKANVTITVLLSTDATVDANDAAAAAVTYRVNLKVGKGRTLKTKFNYPQALADGPYFVLALLDADAADVNSANNAAASPAPITVAMPFVDFSGALFPPPQLTSGKKAAIPLTINNAGNIPARGAINVTLYASTDAALDPADRAIAGPQRLKISLKPSSAKSPKFRFPVPTDLPPGPYFLIATLDATSFVETDLTNNTLIGGAATNVG